MLSEMWLLDSIPLAPLCVLILVTGNAERRRVPRSGNAVPGTGTRERSRSGPVKVHQKRRSSFLDPIPRPLRSGNTVTKVLIGMPLLLLITHRLSRHPLLEEPLLLITRRLSRHPLFGEPLLLLINRHLSRRPLLEEPRLVPVPTPFKIKDELLPKEPSKIRKNEAKRAKKRAKKALKRGGDIGCSTVHEIPKPQKKLNLVPAALSRPDLHGMVNYEMEVLKFLEQDTSSLLGISGKRGMGKSTLLRLVYTSSSGCDSPFRYVFFAEAGIGFTADTLRDVLATSIGLGPTPAATAVNLISDFLVDESFIVLLDDVRVSFDLAASGLPMPLGPRQKVVFTTRDESICAEMGTAGNIIKMECLAKDVAWNLFRYNVGGKMIDADSEIEDLAKEMVAECRGIPSALCTISLSMAGETDVVQWRVAYKMLKIKRPPLHEIEEMDDEDYPRLDYFENELGDPFLCTYLMPKR